MSGRIIKAISSFYYVKEGESVTECKARGHFKKENQSLLVGDIVEYDSIIMLAVIVGIISALNTILIYNYLMKKRKSERKYHC